MARLRRYRWRGFGEQARNPASAPEREQRSGSSGFFGPATGPQITYVRNLRRKHGIPMQGLKELSKADASAEIERLTRRE